MRTIVILTLFALTACGDPVVPSTSDVGVAIDMPGDQSVKKDVSLETCEPLQNAFKVSVRALGRSCFENSDCELALRAGPCDCAIGVGPGAEDQANFDRKLQSFADQRVLLDENQCRNPFACAGDKCANYNVLSNPGELIPRCRGGECEVAQLPSCADYEAKKTGGLISKNECETKADCMLRSDLNPCSCPEPVSGTFPALTAGVIREIIDINNARCATTCNGCPAFQDIDCILEGAKKVCVLTN